MEKEHTTCYWVYLVLVLVWFLTQNLFESFPPIVFCLKGHSMSRWQVRLGLALNFSVFLHEVLKDRRFSSVCLDERLFHWSFGENPYGLHKSVMFFCRFLLLFFEDHASMENI